MDLPTSFFSFMEFLANATSGKGGPTLPNLFIFHGIMKRFEKKSKGYISLFYVLEDDQR